jgi:hypothetical protein
VRRVRSSFSRFLGCSRLCRELLGTGIFSSDRKAGLDWKVGFGRLLASGKHAADDVAGLID